MKQLIEDIRNHKFMNVYLLCGEEAYLKKQYRQKLLAALLDEENSINLNRYEGKGISVPALIDQAETLPFFAEYRVILIENSEFFKSSPAELAAYLEQIPPTTVIVFVEDEADKRGKLYKAVKKYGRIVEFTTQNEDTLIRWILGELKREDKKITRNTMTLFLEKTGTDMLHIQSELEKLLCYTMGREVITSEDVEEICTTHTEGKIFKMLDAMAEKRQRDALDMYYDLVLLKEPPMRILYLITRQLNLLMQVKELRGQGYDVNTIASRCGIAPFIVRNYQKQERHFSQERLRELVERAITLEEAVKTGRMNDRMAVELLLVMGSREEKKTTG
ncbi:MAG: DNA polymerase III subunit delta [Eubacteriales bacterium]|nr:DNA polymerase III subunit delta [Eubacteriales bacterium]